MIQLANLIIQEFKETLTGALSNVTHSVETRRELIKCRCHPSANWVIEHRDAGVRYYCTTALSNTVVDEEK